MWHCAERTPGTRWCSSWDFKRLQLSQCCKRKAIINIRYPATFVLQFYVLQFWWSVTFTQSIHLDVNWCNISKDQPSASASTLMCNMSRTVSKTHSTWNSHFTETPESHLWPVPGSFVNATGHNVQLWWLSYSFTPDYLGLSFIPTINVLHNAYALSWPGLCS